MSDYMTWVENGRYNRARADDRAAARRRSEADREVRSAKDRLRRAEKEGERLAAKEERLLNERLRAETDRLLDGIDEVSDEMRRSLQRYVNETQRDMNGIRRAINDIQDQATRLDHKIDDLANDVSARFQQIADAVAREGTRAQLYSNQYNEILRQINLLHPEKLTPGVVEQEFSPVSDFLRMDLENGDYQAAIGVAQTKIPELISLRTRLEILNLEFEDLQLQLHTLSEEIQQRLRSLLNTESNRREVSVGDNIYEYDGDIVYWTNELFNHAVRNYEALCQRFQIAVMEMDLEDMRTSIQQLALVDVQLSECEDLAQEEFHLFGMIQNIASSIFMVLTRDAAWTLVSSGFADDDARRAYQMSYADGDGNIASFVVIPNREVSAQGKPGEVQFMVDVCDGARVQNRERCAIIRRGVIERLEYSGVDVGTHNRNLRYMICPDKETFITEATAQGDRIKDDRLATVREQMQLTA